MGLALILKMPKGAKKAWAILPPCLRAGCACAVLSGPTHFPQETENDDPDNHVLACLAEDSPAQSVEVHAGLFHDPGDVANPATQVGVLDSILET